jgi:hypothetical protein
VIEHASFLLREYNYSSGSICKPLKHGISSNQESRPKQLDYFGTSLSLIIS